jgi:putative MATE family efflux protein
MTGRITTLALSILFVSLGCRVQGFPFTFLLSPSRSQQNLNQDTINTIMYSDYKKSSSPRPNYQTFLLSAPENDSIEPPTKPSTGAAILALAIPALGAELIDPLMTLADTAFVGRFSETDALAGMGSSVALLGFSFYIFNFFCTATTPLVASQRAAGNEAGAIAVGGQALSFALFLGSLMTIVILAFEQPLLELMGTGITGATANEYALSFLGIRAFAAPAVLCISASTGILRGYLDTKTPIYILVMANIINLILDLILIPGMGLGPTGAAIATTTAEWISALLFLGVLAGTLPSADGALGSNRRAASDGAAQMLVVVPSFSIPPLSEVQPLLLASGSVFLRSLVLQLSLASAAAMAARAGEASASVAAHQIAMQLWILCSYTADSLAAAAQGLIADALGRKDQDKARDVTRTVAVYSVVLGTLLGLGLGVGSATSFLETFFTSDSSVQHELSKILALIVIAQPLNSVVFASDGIVQGASAFVFQAKGMAVSGSTAFGSFLALQYFGDGSETLLHVWTALIVLQIMRGVTNCWKVNDIGLLKIL